MPSTSRQPRSGASRGRTTRERRGRTRGGERDSARTRTDSPSRRRALRRRWVAGLILIALLALAYGVWFTPLLGVAAVRVEHADSVSVTRVRAAASLEHGTPLPRVDTAAVRDRVGSLSGVSDVDVSRSWPSTIVISITERTPVAAMEQSEGTELLDRDGVAYRTVEEKPGELPLLRKVRGDQARKAAVEVVDELPGKLREHVATVSAGNKHRVRFTLDTGAKVVWGAADRGERKAKVLGALLTQDGSVYDVSSPDLPTVH